MFATKNRLSKKKDIEKVFKKGHYFFVKELGIKFLKNDLDCSRFTVIVSNKISKKATERNKIKRRLREILRLNQSKITQNIDLIVLTRPGVKELDYAEMEKQVHYCLKKSKLI